MENITPHPLENGDGDPLSLENGDADLRSVENGDGDPLLSREWRC